MAFPFSALLIRPRLAGSALLGVVVALIIPAQWPAKSLTGWCVGTVVYMMLVAWMMGRLSLDDLRRQASRLDDTATGILALSVVATGASVLAVFAGSRGVDVTLAALSIVCSWLFMQTTFAIHYAHMFYGDIEEGQQRGGLQFSGDDEPDFWDLVYFTVTIGATFQTSDTQVCSPALRRTVAAHGVLAFFFNTAILAFFVNVAASVTGR